MTYKLFLDDYRYPPTKDWIIARNMKDAIWYVENHGIPTFISFDHDLAEEHYAIYDGEEAKSRFDNTGYDFAKWFTAYLIDNELDLPNGFDYYVHSMNPAGKANIEHYMRNFITVRRNK